MAPDVPTVGLKFRWLNMSVSDSIAPFPDLRAAYESSKAIVEDLKLLAQLARDTSELGSPVDGQVIYLPRILAGLRENLEAGAKPIRRLEAELAAVHEQPVRIGNDVGPCAACLAVDLATAIRDRLRLIFSTDRAIREFLTDEDTTRDAPDINDSAFIVAVALAAVPDSHIGGLGAGLGPDWADLSLRIRESHEFRRTYRSITLPKVVSSLKRTLGSPVAMEALEATIDQEFARSADRRVRGRLPGLQPPAPNGDGQSPPAAGRQPRQASREEIPPDKRTRPMTLKEAAHRMGYKGSAKSIAKKLRAAMDDEDVPYERINRQKYFFSMDSFPPEVWGRLKR